MKRLIKRGNIYNRELLAKNIDKAPLGYTPLQRHLAAFKTRAHAAARTGLLALVALTSRFALTGSCTSADPLNFLFGASGR